MKHFIILILISAFVLLFITCKTSKNTEISEECAFDIDTLDFSFGIDYEEPEKYLIPGEESDLSDSFLLEIQNTMGIPTNNIAGILLVCHWVNQNFIFENAGGAMIGINTVDELYKIKKFYGCHSLALIISSILREFGFPAVMIETTDVQWAYDFNEGSINYFAGHVMSEIFINGKWILLDNNCTYIANYDTMNPFISQMTEPNNGYFVFAKGIDIWDYNGHDESFTHDKMLDFSNNITCYEKLLYSVTYSWQD